ncbi:hypothetical protein [Streptomyces ardesiacus]|uniref:hypothetical protein n=1 Tax=Streptomyces ardesiacus TaxID=285564 RepID=UPI002FDB9F67
MDKQAVHGKKVFEYPLAQVVSDGRAADYRVVVPTLTDTDLRAASTSPPPQAGPAPPPRGRGRTTVRCAPLPCTSASCAP